MHRLGAFEHAEGRQQSDESEAVVAVQMGDEDVIEPRCMNTEFLQRQHYSFSAIHQERLIAQLHQLGRGRSRFGRLRTPAS